jgi:hypothetical protein
MRLLFVVMSSMPTPSVLRPQPANQGRLNSVRAAGCLQITLRSSLSHFAPTLPFEPRPFDAVSLSSFPAALTGTSQLHEISATLSPFAATLTRNVTPKSFACHSYRKHRGWCHPFQTKRLCPPRCHPPLPFFRKDVISKDLPAGVCKSYDSKALTTEKPGDGNLSRRNVPLRDLRSRQAICPKLQRSPNSLVTTLRGICCGSFQPLLACLKPLRVECAWRTKLSRSAQRKRPARN